MPHVELGQLGVGNYELLTKLSQGGMGEVFLGRLKGAHGFSRLVAVKVIRPEVARTPEARAAFFDEAQLSARLAHPGIAQVFDFGDAEGTLYLVMEYVAGVSFSFLARRQPSLVPAPQVARLMSQVCRALHAAHEARDDSGQALQVVHRDISPQNLLLSFGGVVKIIDFGIAKMMERRGPDTHQGLLKGKPSYVAPEQIQQGQSDRRSDIWSCAVVAHELLTGRGLFRGPTDWAELNAVISQSIPLPSSVVGALPAGLEEAVMRGLERAPEARWSSALELAEAFEQVAAREGCPSTEAFVEAALADERFAHQTKLSSITEGTRSTELVVATPLPPASALTRPTLPIRGPAVAAKADVEPVEPTIKVQTSRRIGWALGLPAIAVVLGLGAWWVNGRIAGATVAPPMSSPALKVDAAPPAPAPAVTEQTPAPAPPIVAAVETPKTQTKAVRKESKTHKVPGLEPEPVAAVAVPVGTGTINIGARPFALVRIDGVLLGPTPLLSHSLSAGEHLIEWLAPDTNTVRARRAVKVVAGQATTELAE